MKTEPTGAVDLDAMNDDDFARAISDMPMFEQIEEEEVDDNDRHTDESEDLETNDVEDTLNDDGNSEDEDEEVEDNSDSEEDEQDDEETSDSDGDNDTSGDTDFDFESGYKEILKPFKANGKEMKVDSVDDVRRLMQMGAGFSKKMQKLKPHLKIVKSLKDNGLLDQDKLDFLIELSQGKPEAIAKLMEDNDVDPLDIDKEIAAGYKPKSYEVSDSEFNLDQAIDSIRGTDGFEESMKVMGEEWDQKSREIIAENPEIVNVINDHVQSGIFEKVQAEVDKERALGRMTGMSDVEAYREAAGALQKKGILVDSNKETVSKETDPLKREAGKVTKEKSIAKAKAKKKAAAPSGGGGKTHKITKDLSSLSDEEFLREFEKL